MLTAPFYHAFSFVYMIIDLYFFIPAVIAQIFNPTAELVIPIGIPTNEANPEIERQLLTTETKIRKCLK